jgi:hypothetical protein
MTLTEYSFTPSEFILLNGDKFAPESRGGNKLPLLCSDGSVDGVYLTSLMCTAAVLANELEGALELELLRKKVAFGLKETTELVIRPCGQTPNWNGYTLESGVMFVSSQSYSKKGDHSLRNTIYTMLTKDRPRPWEKIIEMVEWGLASSNWLMPVGAEAAAAFSTPFICPAKVRELALSQPSAPIVNMLTSCKKNRPELWRQMMTEINEAFEERQSEK